MESLPRRSHRKHPRKSPPDRTSLPDELLTEILLRLPAEVVYKFRRVCRRWRALTSAPYFVEMHLMQQRAPAILLQENTGSREMEIFLIEKWDNDAAKMSPTITNVRPRCTAAASWHNYHACFSYNGLILLKGTLPPEKKGGKFQSSLTDFVIYNPVNQDTVRILTQGQGLGGEIYGMFLHPILKEYCILWGLFQGRRVRFKMLNLGSQPQWKDIEAGSSVSHRPELPSVDVNDILYWIVGAHYRNGSSNCEETIMAFDIKREEFSTMPHPGPTCCQGLLDRGMDLVANHRAMDLLKMDNFLSFIHFCCPDQMCHSTTTIHIWMLTDVAERFWVKSHTIKLELEHSGLGTVRTIAFANGELLLQWVFERFYACNLEQGTIRRFGRKYMGCMRALAHFKSLVSLRNCKPEIKMEEPMRRTRAQNAVKYF